MKSARSRFFLGALQAVTGLERDRLDREAVWRQLAFSNYIQALLPETRTAPTESMWVDAEAAWPEHLAEVRAPIVMVCGWRLWRGMTAKGGVQLEPLRDLDDRVVVEDAWAYPTSTATFAACRLRS